MFFHLLKSEGLIEDDIPSSTRPIHDLPIFQESNKVFPHFYHKKEQENQFPKATFFYNHSIKLPIWYNQDEIPIAKKYINGLLKVSLWIKLFPDMIIDFYN